MTLQEIIDYCDSLPFTDKDLKWEHNLCFLICEKIFCIGSLDEEFSISFKTNETDFEMLTHRADINPAPYLGRSRWVNIKKPDALSKDEWEEFIKRSYNIIKAKLPRSKRDKLG